MCNDLSIGYMDNCMSYGGGVEAGGGCRTRSKIWTGRLRRMIPSGIGDDNARYWAVTMAILMSCPLLHCYLVSETIYN